MSVVRKGEYVLLSNNIPLEDELSELEIPVPEPATLHKRNIQTSASAQRSRSARRGCSPSWHRQEIREDGRPGRSHTYIQMDVVPGIGTRQFDGVRWTSAGADHRQNLDAEETVKCIISSVLFLAIVVTVIVVAIVKNPEM